MNPDYIILGGGPAALAFSYYALRSGKTVLVIEKEKSLGGNASTFREGDFLFDSGAHRWHNVYPDITKDILNLLGNDLKIVNVPSSIYLDGKWIEFPLRPFNLLRALGTSECLKVIASYLAKNFSSSDSRIFSGTVTRRFGKVLSELFLIPYTRKLWGISPELLTSEVAGKRLKGFGARSFIGKHEEHLDGAFYYPRLGIGMIFEEIEKLIPSESRLTQAEIKSIRIENDKIQSIELSDRVIPVNQSIVVNTLAPNTFRFLCGKPLFQNLSFRHVVLMFLTIRRSAITEYSSIYFPESDIPFTRIVEPKLRSAALSPEGMTSLVVEVPAFGTDRLWTASDKELENTLFPHINKSLGIKRSEVDKVSFRRIPNAYPVLSLLSVPEKDSYLKELASVRNLKLLGRNSTFSYLHLHDLFYEAKSYLTKS